MIKITLKDGEIIFITKESSISIDEESSHLCISGLKPITIVNIRKLEYIGKETEEEKTIFDHLAGIIQ